MVRRGFLFYAMKKEKKKPGGTSKKNRTSPQQLSVLASFGLTDAQIAQAIDINEATLNRWKNNDPVLLQALKKGKEVADALVEASLFHRATGYSFPSEKVFQHEGKIVRAEITEHVPPDVGAMCFWLKNRRPDLWRDKHEHEHSGNVTVVNHIPRKNK